MKEYILNEINDANIEEVIKNNKLEHGTIFKITELRDNWEDHYVKEVFNDLEVLVPPKEQNTFDLYLYSSEKPNEYGHLVGSICDDFDYKIVAKADKDQNVNIKIYREEYDVNRINPKLFEFESMKEDMYSKDTFQNGFWEKNTEFSKLIPGYEDIDDKNNLNKIGDFEFTSPIPTTSAIST
ncbi:hypothetical protein [Sulfurimonas sp.]|uniref:hypothetical protein n=1 Tax=Sulfurimonas sp. TaxID=2022749 RepID=UPI0025D60C4D|nr:hypothetical protein [Sulfurimonas sp.]